MKTPNSIPPIRGLFVTGTDTSVGKTFVTALLLTELRRRGVRAAGFKPIACGTGGRADAKLFASLMDGETTMDEVNPVYMRKPLAPLIAARLDQKKIDFRKIFTNFKSLTSRHDFILVEGAGGWLVPITRQYFVRDLARDLRLPVVIVARPRLGTLNHTLQTVEGVRAAKLSVAAIVINDTTGEKPGLAERTNPGALRELTHLPVFTIGFGATKAPAALLRMLI